LERRDTDDYNPTGKEFCCQRQLKQTCVELACSEAPLPVEKAEGTLSPICPAADFKFSSLSTVSWFLHPKQNHRKQNRVREAGQLDRGHKRKSSAKKF
jgi:hypothetical protein